MIQSNTRPLLRKVDCIRLFVPDLDAGLAFYCQQLGHELVWRTDHAAGLRMPESEAEIVLQKEEPRQEILDTSKGLLQTDESGKVIGNKKPE